MLYSKASFNYWLRIQMYFRLMFLYELFKNKFGRKINYPWNIHIKNFQREGISYLSWSTWYHHCTDGPECKVANIYKKSEIICMLEDAGFCINRMIKAHFPIGGKWPALERYVARFVGFYQFVWATRK
jgi:hypothetical protein